MPSYRKKPVVVEAVKFDPCGEHKMELPEGVIMTKMSPGADNFCYMGFEFGIKHADGSITPVIERDWIIKHPDGSFSSCGSDEFESTYETF